MYRSDGLFFFGMMKFDYVFKHTFSLFLWDDVPEVRNVPASRSLAPLRLSWG